MNDKLNLRELAIPVPIPASFRRQAQVYASQFFVQDVQKRIYRQTLALLAVDNYLRLLGFETNLNQPERWNVTSRLWSEANELEIAWVGNLECCLIAAEQQSMILSQSQLSSGIGIGYVFVEITNSEKTAILTGFLPALQEQAEDREIRVADLMSIDDFIDDLSERQISSSSLEKIDNLTTEFAEKKIIYLQNWLNHIYEEGWEPSMRDLQTVTCHKKLQLGGQVFDIQLGVSQSSDELVLVRVIVQSEGTNLPMGMQVSVPDEADIYTETVNEIASLISIPLELAPEENFWIELSYKDESIREYFIA
ncbi:DUF1822 family protein [Plectonema cf. radiosum LEGE 06105]|uniref:DUF1822 family protein n=1 Tax=Plectonema cf. radiosum LEGE 06105 TaxID=945769 RepID=A0A8J7F8F9_9CYAN|nr:DUF1822 family protein [Plectonema radiosum]MBE9211328.1 DUF1822 family protein [Plectonema cf. radiosum LEGE 06105]